MGGQSRLEMGGRSKARACRPPPPTFSTTGRSDVEASLASSKRGAQHWDAQDQPVVALLRMSKREGDGIPDRHSDGLPERLLLGGGWPCVGTIGRHDDSEVHCQVALRGFRLLGHAEGYEAAFLRDNSRKGMMVNGEPAFRPWHWLQHGDYIGIRHNSQGQADHVVENYRVEYCSHRRLPGLSVAVEEEAPPPPTAAGRPTASHADFRGEVRGRVVDVHYKDQDPPATYCMRIMGFDRRTGLHRCDSAGLDTRDGESFDDVLDLNLMYREGHMKFVDLEKDELDESSQEERSPPPPPQAPLQRSLRKRSRSH